MGDFNFRDINWTHNNAPSALSKKFLSCLEDNLLFQLVKKPTRGSNILDLVLSGNPDLVHSVDVGDKLGASDHRSVLVQLRIPVPRIALSNRKIYLYSKGDYDAYSEEVKSTNWDKVFANKKFEDKWSLLQTKYDEWRDKFIPCKLVKTGQRHKPPWTNFKSVRTAKRKKRVAAVKAKKSGLNVHQELFDKAKANVDSSIYKAKMDYEDMLVNQIKTEPKKFYNYARHFCRSSATVEVLEHEGQKLTDDTDKAEILNDFFASVLKIEPEREHINTPLPARLHIQNIYDVLITPAIVREKLCKLHLNKACGTDGFHVNILRNVPDYDVPLSMLFNSSLHEGLIPQDWKDANITPLFKKGSRLSPNNYRPVSLTSQVVKILERVIYDQLMEYIQDNNIISCHQHGFQKKCSCVTQLLECLFDWTNSYDDDKGVDAIYLDFRKAFDTVPHKRLLYKLNHLGVRGHLLAWIGGFLTGRRQRVILRNGASSWKKVTSGVPQGSILGPLLFLLYVNDIPDAISSSIAKMFADDTKVYNSIVTSADCDALQADLNALAAWSHLWLLEFNADKCVVLRIKAAVSYLYSLNGVYLQEVVDQKDLGITVSNNLTPTRHVQDIVKKAHRKIAMFRRCFSGFDATKVKILYQSLIRPALEYASTAWSPNLKKDIDALEKVQAKCLRLCWSDKVEMESLETRRMKTDLVDTYKFLHGHYKTDPDKFFSLPHKDLRGHSMKLFQRRSKTSLANHFYSNRVVKSWNNLPKQVVAAPTIAAFKQNLRALPLGPEG